MHCWANKGLCSFEGLQQQETHEIPFLAVVTHYYKPYSHITHLPINNCCLLLLPNKVRSNRGCVNYSVSQFLKASRVRSSTGTG